jgi:hypothetical protein
MFYNIFRYVSSRSKCEATIEKKHSKCLVAKCNKRAEYAYYAREKPQFCFEHKDLGMINVCM